MDQCLKSLLQTRISMKRPRTTHLTCRVTLSGECSRIFWLLFHLLWLSSFNLLALLSFPLQPENFEADDGAICVLEDVTSLNFFSSSQPAVLIFTLGSEILVPLHLAES